MRGKSQPFAESNFFTPFPLGRARLPPSLMGQGLLGRWLARRLALPILSNLPSSGPIFTRCTKRNALVTDGEEIALVATTNLLLIRRGFGPAPWKIPRRATVVVEKGAHRGYQDPPPKAPRVTNALQQSPFPYCRLTQGLILFE